MFCEVLINVSSELKTRKSRYQLRETVYTGLLDPDIRDKPPHTASLRSGEERIQHSTNFIFQILFIFIVKIMLQRKYKIFKLSIFSTQGTNSLSKFLVIVISTT